MKFRGIPRGFGVTLYRDLMKAVEAQHSNGSDGRSHLEIYLFDGVTLKPVVLSLVEANEGYGAINISAKGFKIIRGENIGRYLGQGSVHDIRGGRRLTREELATLIFNDQANKMILNSSERIEDWNDREQPDYSMINHDGKNLGEGGLQV
jgi:hypothetical protein